MLFVMQLDEANYTADKNQRHNTDLVNSYECSQSSVRSRGTDVRQIKRNVRRAKIE